MKAKVSIVVFFALAFVLAGISSKAGAGEAGEGVLGPESAHIRGLTENLGGGQGAASANLEQAGCLLGDLLGDLGFQLWHE